MAYMITELDPLAAICKTVLVPVIGLDTSHKNNQFSAANVH
jgi:hypothetical protein